MELMDQDLESLLLTRKKNPIGWDKAVKKWKNETKKRIREPLRQLLGGLRALHDAGITHRDLKPLNVLLDKEHNVKITDFGVSKQARDRVQTTMSTGTGTTGYTAPEVLQVGETFHGNYTEKADLWSLGCVVYRMIKGCQLLAHDQETKTEARERVGGLAENNWEGFASPEANLLKKLLCVDPEERSCARCAEESYTLATE
ncbi:unnamed protein product [Colletotrichum noveboracense]|uniref:Protein kinase domain-containing protein n=1 Tax=Colletotrichum noveboracense TaxID=2664923 RepID=A0A9W4WFZ1_9PEZI|nr:unnamed protein product [Colletotrichum noveboracense]